MARIDYPPNSPTTVSPNDAVYTYDENATGQNGLGQLTTVTDESGITAYKYDPQGNVIHIAVKFSKTGGGTFALDYEYDQAGRVQKISYPSGRHVSYARAAGFIVSSTTDLGSVSTNLAKSVIHAPFGPITSFNFGDVGSTPFSRVLDSDYRVRGISHGTMLNLQYSYVDPSTNRVTQNVMAITDIGFGAKSQVFTYDYLNRLMSVTSAAYGSQVYSTVADPYDAVGNRSETTNNGGPAQAYTYQPGTNRLLNVSNGGPSYGYDLAGEVTSRDQFAFNYGDDRRLKTVTDNSQSPPLNSNYNHNYLGQRVRKSTGSQVTYFLYGLDGSLLSEIDGVSNIPITEYAYLEGTPIALFTPQKDSDEDDIPDDWETMFGLNPNNDSDASSDFDQDGMSALQEFQAGTDPTKADTDGDGIKDGWDSTPTVSNTGYLQPILKQITN